MYWVKICSDFCYFLIYDWVFAKNFLALWFDSNLFGIQYQDGNLNIKIGIKSYSLKRTSFTLSHRQPPSFQS